MKLYHFTAAEYVPAIAAVGLWKGEVPVTHRAEDCLNAVWLTSAAAAGKGSDHGLTDGRPLSVEEKLERGLPPDAPNRFPDKRAVRFTVIIPRGDRRLVPWNAWARKRLDPQWLSTLEQGGGGAALARTWFLYWGAIPHDWITEFRDMRVGASFSWPAMRVAAAEFAAAAEGGR